jgi:Putative Actinobacterial Holin-X, holin superfamily III
LNGFVVALILALATIMPGWEAALLVGVVMLVIGAALGFWAWNRRVTDPLALTRKMIRETAQWAKERLA